SLPHRVADRADVREQAPPDLGRQRLRAVAEGLQRRQQHRVVAVLVDLEQARQRPLVRRRQLGQQALHPALLLARQALDAIAQRARDARERTRVVQLQHQQVKQRRQLAAGLELRAVGDRRVEQAQQQREAVVARRQVQLQPERERLREEVQAL